jgi:hypothetical protein
MGDPPIAFWGKTIFLFRKRPTELTDVETAGFSERNQPTFLVYQNGHFRESAAVHSLDHGQRHRLFRL